MPWPHSKARELICSGQTGPLENTHLKGEGKKPTLKAIFFIHRKQNVMEQMLRERVRNHVVIYLNPTLQIR